VTCPCPGAPTSSTPGQAAGHSARLFVAVKASGAGQAIALRAQPADSPGLASVGSTSSQLALRANRLGVFLENLRRSASPDLATAGFKARAGHWRSGLFSRTAAEMTSCSKGIAGGEATWPGADAFEQVADLPRRGQGRIEHVMHSSSSLGTCQVGVAVITRGLGLGGRRLIERFAQARQCPVSSQ